LKLSNVIDELKSCSIHRIKVINEAASIVDLLADGSDNAFITDTEQLTFMEKSLDGSVKFTVLKEKIMSDYLAFTFFNSDYLLKPVNRIISQLYESGIAQRIIDKESSVKYQETTFEPSKLSLDHLGVWFYACAFMLLVAASAFVIEFSAQKLISNPAGKKKGGGGKKKRRHRQTSKQQNKNNKRLV
jgi:hypothetical protein